MLRTTLSAAFTLALVGCGGSSAMHDAAADSRTDTTAPTDASRDAPSPTDTHVADATPPADVLASDDCAVPASAEPPVVLADFESGSIPSSTTLPEGFRDSDVARGTIVHPGANGTSAAASFDLSTDPTMFFQGMLRPQFLNGSSAYDPALANAVEFYVNVPSGSALLSPSGGATYGFWTYHWNPGDPWVGPNGSGGNLTDSQMHGYSNFRFAPSAAGTWTHVVLSTSAFGQSRGNYHFFAARAVVQDLTFFGALRQFELTAFNPLSSPSTVELDQMQLITLPATASVCPDFASQTVSATGGDVSIPVEIANPTGSARGYRVFISSEIGLDRQTLEGAMHDNDDVGSVDDLQGGVNADGSLGAVELFAASASGSAMGSSIVGAGAEIMVASGGTWRGVLVHHVTPGMLGSTTMVTSDSNSYSVRRNTLTTSMIVWDPTEPSRGDPSAVFVGSNADSDHAAPPGFPTYAAPPTGWASTDVPMDQAGGYFVSVLTLN